MTNEELAKINREISEMMEQRIKMLEAGMRSRGFRRMVNFWFARRMNRLIQVAERIRERLIMED